MGVVPAGPGLGEGGGSNPPRGAMSEIKIQPDEVAVFKLEDGSEVLVVHNGDYLRIETENVLVFKTVASNVMLAETARHV